MNPANADELDRGEREYYYGDARRYARLLCSNCDHEHVYDSKYNTYPLLECDLCDGTYCTECRLRYTCTSCTSRCPLCTKTNPWPGDEEPYCTTHMPVATAARKLPLVEKGEEDGREQKQA